MLYTAACIWGHYSVDIHREVGDLRREASDLQHEADELRRDKVLGYLDRAMLLGLDPKKADPKRVIGLSFQDFQNEEEFLKILNRLPSSTVSESPLPHPFGLPGEGTHRVSE